MIWAVSILLFVIVFLIADRMIANKGDSYVDYSNAYQAKYLLTKKRMERIIQKASGIRK